MATRTVEPGYFGAAGHGDPEFSFTDKTIGVSWDFAKTNVPASKTIPILQIPKGFCIDRISLVQTAPTNADATVTFGLASDNSSTVGGNFALKDGVGETALCRSSQTPVTGQTPGALFVDADDVLCLITPNVALTAGAFSLFVHGFSAFGEGPTENKTGNEVYRKSLQTEDNVAGPRPSFD